MIAIGGGSKTKGSVEKAAMGDHEARTRRGGSGHIFNTPEKLGLRSLRPGTLGQTL